MEKQSVLELVQVGVCLSGVIKYGEFGEECVSYSNIWFVGDEPIIAEPYSINEKGEKWFYDREVEFSIIDVIE